MGAKIPFRFPMIDALVPTVQMYDVSSLVSAPIEPRALSGTTFGTPVEGRTTVFELHSLAPGGVFVEHLTLVSEVTDQGGWQVIVNAARDPAILPPALNKIDIGGREPTVSELFADDVPFPTPIGAGTVVVPVNIAFNEPARWFVPAGSVLRVVGPRAGPIFFQASFLAVVWTELPASFELP